MIFKGRNQIPYAYGCYGYTRGGGATWHGGQDIVGLDDVRVRALRGGKVIRSRIVTDHSNLTWEWGNYVTIRTECGEQDIYAHLDSRAVVAGQTVKAGDVIGIMGSTGNAAGGYKHTHYERRKPDGKTAIDPSSAVSSTHLVVPAVHRAGTEGVRLRGRLPRGELRRDRRAARRGGETGRAQRDALDAPVRAGGRRGGARVRPHAGGDGLVEGVRILGKKGPVLSQQVQKGAVIGCLQCTNATLRTWSRTSI